MKTKLSYALVTAILLGVATFAGYSQVGPGVRPLQKLTFSMTPANPRVLLLEPISLKFGLANQTNENLDLKNSINLHSIQLTVRKPRGEVFTPGQLSFFSGPRILADRIKTIPPGENLTWSETLEFNLGQYFGEVGEYQLRASYKNGNHTLDTEWVTLVVEQPQGEDFLAYERLKTLTGTFDGVFTNGTTKNRLAFVHEFPNSRYADYSRYSAALDLSDKDEEMAKQLFRKIEAKPDFVFASNAKEKLKELNQKKKEN